MPASDAGYHFFSDYRKCQKFWYWRYVRKLLPLKQSAAPEAGKIFHEVLAVYYSTIQKGVARPEVAAEEKLANLIPSHDIEETPTRELYLRLLNAFRMYHSAYMYDPYWEVLAVEETYDHVFKVRQDYGKYHRTVPVYFTGRIDLVVRWNGAIYIVDHKTTSWIMGKVAESLMMSDQATGYVALWNAKHPMQPASETIYNIIKVDKGHGDAQKELVRPLVTRTQNDIDSFLLDIAETSREVQQKLTKKTARFVQDRNACYLYNSNCAYSDLCMGASPEGLIGISYKIDDGMEN